METNRIKEFFNKDIFIRILSIFIALALWGYVSYVLDPETQKDFANVPVKFINEQSLLSSGLTLVENNYMVSFSVKGRRNVIGSIKQDRLWAVADLAGFNNVGKNKISLKVSGLPSSVDLVKEPQDILVEMDKVYSIEKAVNIYLKGEPQKGYAALTPVVKPIIIKIDGAKRIVNSIADAKVIIDITNMDANLTTKEKLLIVDSKGNEVKNIKTDIDVVEVSIPIVKTKEVSIKHVLEGELPKDTFLDKVTVKTDKVLIIDNEKTNSIEYLNLESINLKNISESTNKKLKIITPDDVKLVNSDGIVDVEIQVKKQITKNYTLNISNLRIKDKKAVFDYEVLNDRFNVTVSGMEDKINSTSNDLISLSVSVKELTEGQFNLISQVSLPEGIKVKGEAPTVSLKITQKIE